MRLLCFTSREKPDNCSYFRNGVAAFILYTRVRFPGVSLYPRCVKVWGKIAIFGNTKKDQEGCDVHKGEIRRKQSTFMENYLGSSREEIERYYDRLGHLAEPQTQRGETMIRSFKEWRELAEDEDGRKQ